MADKEVADLTSAGTLDGTESFHLVKGGNSRKSLVSAVLTYIQGAIFGTFGLAFAGNEDATAARGDLGLEDTSTDNTVVRFDGTAGQTQSSGVVIDDSNNVSGVGTLSMGDALTVSEHGTAPSTPASGKAVIYAKADGLFYGKDDAGTETKLSNAASAGPTLIATLNGASGSPSTLSVTGLAGYNKVWAVFEGLSPSSNGVLRVAASTNNGSSYGTATSCTGSQDAVSTYYGMVELVGLAFGYMNFRFNGVASLVPTTSSSGTQGVSSSITGGGFAFAAGTAINALQFSPQSGNFDAGTIKIYAEP